jgi:hypothetical protein
MASPLLEYINGSILITSTGVPSIVNGRVTVTSSTKYLVQAYLVRQQSTGTTTGGDYIPTQGNPGETLPGSSGIVYLYTGYAIRYGSVSNTYKLTDAIPSNITWINLDGTNTPTWLQPGISCDHLQGNEQVKFSKIERISGKYGNTAIDAIINKEIGGIPIVIRSGEVVN